MDLVTTILACSLYADNSIVNAIAQVGAKNQPLTITVEGGETTNFTKPEQAAAYADKKIAEGQTIEIGLMQISSHWLQTYQVTPADLLFPCKNIVVATKILNSAESQCTPLSSAPVQHTDTQACALSLYKTGDPQAGLEYAQTVLDYAKAHPFETLEAAAEAHNPRGFHMTPGDKLPLKNTKNTPAS